MDSDQSSSIAEMRRLLKFIDAREIIEQRPFAKYSESKISERKKTADNIEAYCLCIVLLVCNPFVLSWLFVARRLFFAAWPRGCPINVETIYWA